MGGGLIDAKAAGEYLGVPHTWVLEQARRDAIPHVRLGRYVRFEPGALAAWAENRLQGPVYPTRDRTQPSGPGDVEAPRGQTPKG